MDDQVTVVQYNILSQALANPRSYSRSNALDLEPKTRLERVWHEHLLPCIEKDRAVICLQEVSQTWYGELHDLFAEQGYQMTVSLYGGWFNDYMGVAVAYPIDRFTASNTRVVNVGGQLPRAPPKERIGLKNTRVWRWGEALFLWLLLLIIRVIALVKPSVQKSYDDSVFDPLDYSRKRSNTVIMTTLTSKQSGRSVAVAVYHFPCAFWSPPVMTLHTIAAITTTRRYAAGRPVIFCTDANFMPDAPQYQIVTNPASLTQPLYPAHPAVKLDDSLGPYRSAYCTVWGREPHFTNHAWGHTNSAFTGTLDYIFYAGSINPTWVKPLPDDPPAEFFPSREQPSDHLLISASFAF